MISMGEFRGWLDTTAPDASYDEVIDVYRRVAKMRLEEERAYCVTEGIRRGVIVLCFGYDWGDDYRDSELRGVVSLHAPPGVYRAVRRPMVFPKALNRSQCEPLADVFPNWPVADPDLIEFNRDRHVEVRDAHLDSYFEQFANHIDRRTLLVRKEVAR